MKSDHENIFRFVRYFSDFQIFFIMKGGYGKMIICYYSWLLIIICYYWWLFVIIDNCLLLLMIIDDYLLLMIICYYW